MLFARFNTRYPYRYLASGSPSALCAHSDEIQVKKERPREGGNHRSHAMDE